MPKADHVVELQGRSDFVERLIGEAAIGEDRNANVVRDGQTHQVERLILIARATILEVTTAHGPPYERRRAPVGGHHVDRDRGLLVVRVLGPVERHHHVFSLADDEGHPAREHLIHADARVAQESIDLLDRVLRIEPARDSETLPDRMHGRRCAVQDAEDSVTEGEHALLVELVVEHVLQEANHLGFTDLGLCLHALRLSLGAHRSGRTLLAQP